MLKIKRRPDDKRVFKLSSNKHKQNSRQNIFTQKAARFQFYCSARLGFCYCCCYLSGKGVCTFLSPLVPEKTEDLGMKERAQLNSQKDKMSFLHVSPGKLIVIWQHNFSIFLRWLQFISTSEKLIIGLLDFLLTF